MINILQGEARSKDDAAENGAPPPSAAASPFWALKSAPKEPSGFSPVVAFCFTINYIVGTGFLTIPWAFVRGGPALSAAVLIAVSVLADAAKDYILESMARAEAMLDGDMRWAKSGRRPDEGGGLLVYSPVISREDTEEMEMVDEPAGRVNYDSLALVAAKPVGADRQLRASSAPSTPKITKEQIRGRRLVHKKKHVPKYVVKQRKFEVNTLCRVFLGKTGLRLYTFFVSLYIYGLLWAYTSVFSSAMAKAVPIIGRGDADDANYSIYTVIFGLVVVPMSCLELDEQVAVQVFLTGCRFLMVFLMVGTSSLCAGDIGIGDSDEPEDDESGDPPPALFRWSEVHRMLPIVVFATIYHHSIPGLSHPVSDKKRLGGIFRWTCAFTAVAYSFIGVVLGWTFGERIEQSANLNWKGFRGGTGTVDGGGNIVDVATWARAVSAFVLCFPALDVVSAFPLNAITLGNSIMGAFHGSNIHEAESNRWFRVRFRLLAGIPPVLGGLLVRELGVITDYAGTTGFAITFSFPALLYIRSRRAAEERNFATGTYYTAYASSEAVALVIFWFGVAMVIFVLTLLVKN